MTDIGGAVAGSLVVALILGGLVGVFVLARRKEAPGVHGVAAWYLQSAIAVSAVIALGGLAQCLTAIIGYINLSSSYVSQSASAGSVFGISPAGSAGLPATSVREVDLIYGIIAILIGAAGCWFHWTLAQRTDTPLEDYSRWGWWAAPLITAVVMVLVGGAGALQFFAAVVSDIVANTSTPWGPQLATAVVFLCGWWWLTKRLLASVMQGQTTGNEGAAPVDAG